MTWLVYTIKASSKKNHVLNTILFKNIKLQQTPTYFAFKRYYGYNCNTIHTLPCNTYKHFNPWTRSFFKIDSYEFKIQLNV